MITLNSQSLDSAFHNRLIMCVRLIILTASVGEVRQSGSRVGEAYIPNHPHRARLVCGWRRAVQFRLQKFPKAYAPGGRTPDQLQQ